MSLQVDVESAFADFVRKHGGEVVEDLLGASPDFKNADYLFRSNGVVAELKRLVEDKSEDEKIKGKIQQKFDGWMNDGTIGPVYGHVRVQSNTLPEKCQRELIDIYKPPIQRRIIKANKQIKATLDRFKIQNGKGLVIIVNDGNYALEADAALYIINRILGESFRQINSIVYCTINMFAQSPMTPKPTLLWVNASRSSVPCVEQEFVMSLFSGWSAYLSELRGESIEQILLNDPSLVESIRYARKI